MITLTTFITYTVIIFVLAGVGYFLNQSQRTDNAGNYLRLASFVTLIIFSIYLFANPISIVTGESESKNLTYTNGSVTSEQTSIDYERSSISSTLNYVISFVYLLLALWGFLTTVIKMRKDYLGKNLYDGGAYV